MISIRRLINTGASETEEALRHAISLLLQVVAVHAIQGDESDCAEFKASMWQKADRFAEVSSAEEMLVIAGAVAKSLREHGERTAHQLRAHHAEYRQMVSMLTETIASVTHGSDRSIQRLREVETQLSQASVVNDVRLLRGKLEHCLGSIQSEIKMQESQAAAAANLRNGLETSRNPSHAPPEASDNDPVTGLPTRAAAEAALAEAIHGSGTSFAVAFVVNRVQTVNARFGYAVGDRLLVRVCEQFRSALSAEDRLYRWRGPGMLAILSRAAGEAEVRKEIARIASVDMQETVDLGTRSVLLPVSASWSVFPILRSAAQVMMKIDQFVASQAPAE